MCNCSSVLLLRVFASSESKSPHPAGPRGLGRTLLYLWLNETSKNAPLVGNFEKHVQSSFSHCPHGLLWYSGTIFLAKDATQSHHVLTFGAPLRNCIQLPNQGSEFKGLWYSFKCCLTYARERAMYVVQVEINVNIPLPHPLTTGSKIMLLNEKTAEISG